MNPTKTILFLLISALVLALYPKPADAVYQCRGGNRNVENGVCRTTLYDDGVRCPDNKPSTSCFGFAVAPGGGGAPVDAGGDAATPVELSPTGPTRPAVAVAAEPRRIPVGEVDPRSPSVALSKVGVQVAPDIVQVDPQALVGKRLTIDQASRIDTGTITICIGRYNEKDRKCSGILIVFEPRAS